MFQRFQVGRTVRVAIDSMAEPPSHRHTLHIANQRTQCVVPPVRFFHPVNARPFQYPDHSPCVGEECEPTRCPRMSGHG